MTRPGHESAGAARTAFFYWLAQGGLRHELRPSWPCAAPALRCHVLTREQRAGAAPVARFALVELPRWRTSGTSPCRPWWHRWRSRAPAACGSLGSTSAAWVPGAPNRAAPAMGMIWMNVRRVVISLLLGDGHMEQWFCAATCCCWNLTDLRSFRPLRPSVGRRAPTRVFQ